ncbi:MAG: DUF302 domain-containing protein [Candidatus Neomarinimicrobiota bacterium]
MHLTRNWNAYYVSVFLLVFWQAAAAQDQTAARSMKLPESQVIRASAYDFNDTVEILAAAIEEENLMLIKEIDAQKMLKMVDKKVGGMKQLLFFHPRYMKRIIETNPLGSIEPPLKLAIMERPDKKVIIKYIKPTHLFSQYQGLESIGEELEEVVHKISLAVQQ